MADAMFPAPIRPIVEDSEVTRPHSTEVHRSLVAVYGLLIVGDVLWSALFPLGPAYRDELGLSATEVGVLLAAFPVAVLIVSLPAGQGADRIGPLRVTTIAGLIMAIGAIGQSVAPSFVTLLAARSLQGLGFGAIWPAGLAYLQEVLPEHLRTRILSGSMVVAGLATMIGPTFGGALATRYDAGTPFVVGGIATVALLLLLVGLRDTTATHRSATPLIASAKRLRRDYLAVAGFAFMALPGYVANTIHLLIPLDLEDVGIGEAAIGIGLTVGAALFLCTSIVLARLGSRAARVGVGAIAAAGLGLLCVIPIVSTAAEPLFVLLGARGLPLATLFSIAAPLAALGGARVGVGRAGVLGIANAVWAVSAITGPVVAGILSDHVSDSAPWVLNIALCGAVAGWAARKSRARVAAA
jgi:MFS family permease